MPIDLAEVNWIYVIILAFFVFVASWLGNIVSWQSRTTAAGLTALLFVAFFVGWSYYPHRLPLPTRLGDTLKPAVVAPPPTTPPTPPTPPKPANPVRDITPPRNPVTDITPQQPAR